MIDRRLECRPIPKEGFGMEGGREAWLGSDSGLNRQSGLRCPGCAPSLRGPGYRSVYGETTKHASVAAPRVDAPHHEEAAAGNLTQLVQRRYPIHAPGIAQVALGIQSRDTDPSADQVSRGETVDRGARSRGAAIDRGCSRSCQVAVSRSGGGPTQRATRHRARSACSGSPSPPRQHHLCQRGHDTNAEYRSGWLPDTPRRPRSLFRPPLAVASDPAGGALPHKALK